MPLHADDSFCYRLNFFLMHCTHTHVSSSMYLPFSFKTHLSHVWHCPVHASHPAVPSSARRSVESSSPQFLHVMRIGNGLRKRGTGQPCAACGACGSPTCVWDAIVCHVDAWACSWRLREYPKFNEVMVPPMRWCRRAA